MIATIELKEDIYSFPMKKIQNCMIYEEMPPLSRLMEDIIMLGGTLYISYNRNVDIRMLKK